MSLAQLLEKLRRGEFVESVVLQRCRLSDAEIESLARAIETHSCAQSSASVTVTQCNLSAQQITRLIDALCSRENLEFVDFMGNASGGEGLASVVKLLSKETSKLRFLNISECDLPVSAARVICESLATNRCLRTLILRWNTAFGLEESAFARALSQNMHLQQLNLARCSLSIDAASNIARASKIGRALTTLCLDGNNLGDAGASAVVEKLGSNCTLTSLMLRDSNIADDGARAVADFACTCRTLVVVFLDRNPCGDGCVDALAKAFRESPSLMRCGLNQTRFTPDGLLALAQAAVTSKSLKELLIWQIETEGKVPALQELQSKSVSVGIRTEVTLAKSSAALLEYQQLWSRALHLSDLEKVDELLKAHGAPPCSTKYCSWIHYAARHSSDEVVARLLLEPSIIPQMQLINDMSRTAVDVARLAQRPNMVIMLKRAWRRFARSYAAIVEDAIFCIVAIWKFRRRASDFEHFGKDVVLIICREIWKTKHDCAWLQAWEKETNPAN